MNKKYIFFYLLLLILSLFIMFSEKAFTEERILGKSEDFQSMMPTKIIKKIPLPGKGYHEGLMLEDGTIFVNNGEHINTWVIDLTTGDLIKEIQPVATFTEGICKGPAGKYWVTDWDMRKLYLVQIINNKMVPEFEVSTESAHPTGIAWTGTYLYMVTWARGMGTKYHILKLDQKGNVLEKVQITEISEPSQAAWDGQHLWISSWFTRRVYKVDMETLQIKGYFRSNIEKTSGIAWDGKYFWVTGTKSGLRQIELLKH